MYNYFKGKIIPNGIHFYDYDFINEDFINNDKIDCDCITNGGLDVDLYNGITKKNKNCNGISCIKCVFFHMNTNERLEYFSYLNNERKK